ncbi:MAG: ABC transporter substrate-binding protein [Clostridia bacterium]|nr:ABC transporter substrate-binding protein [Clostridia bacterium]
MKRLLNSAISLILLMCVCVGACVAEPIVVTDQVGREVIFEKSAEKLVSCYYISTATLIALGLEDNLVGIEMKADTRGLYAIAAPQIVSLPEVGSGKGINVEEIAALSPDVVILPRKLKDDADTLGQLGINVIVVDPESQEQFEECVTLLGAVTGKNAEAASLLEKYNEITANVTAAVEGLETPSVYMASGSDFYTTYPAGIYQDDLITIAGGVNVAGVLEGDGKATIDAEQLLAWDPEYIFIVADADYTVEDVLADTQLSELSAVKSGNVYAFPSNIEAWDYPTPSSVLGQMYMASILHPEAVSEEDFAATALDFYLNVFAAEVTSADLGMAE